MNRVAMLCLVAGVLSCNTMRKKEDHQVIEVLKTNNSIILDGKATENAWNSAQWHALDQNWLGSAFTHEDLKAGIN